MFISSSDLLITCLQSLYKANDASVIDASVLSYKYLLLLLFNFTKKIHYQGLVEAFETNDPFKLSVCLKNLVFDNRQDKKKKQCVIVKCEKWSLADLLLTIKLADQLKVKLIFHFSYKIDDTTNNVFKSNIYTKNEMLNVSRNSNTFSVMLKKMMK